MKRVFFVVALLVGSLLAGLAISASASAAVPCRDRIFNDWYHDGRIASSYPTSCYRDALRHIPADAKIYSSLATDINAAMLASIHRQQGKSAPKEVGHGLKAMQSGSNGQLVSLGNTSTPHDPAADGTAPSSAGPASAASATDAADSGSSPPLPILVLGGIALALAAAGAVGTGVRHVRRRR